MSEDSPSLTARLKEKLDAAVQSPDSHTGKAGKIPSSVVVDDSSDDAPARKHAKRPTETPSSHAAKATVSKCSYRDFSGVLPEDRVGASSLIAQNHAAKEPTFPVKLHMILSNPEFQDIISWLPHGRSWRILQQKAFEERVIPLYFRHGRYSSFARQVNGWGFRRVTHGSDYNSYYHEMFLRGMPHLCEKMRRLTNKDTATRKKMEDEPAPDFYALSRTHPLPESKPTAAPGHTLPVGFGVPPMGGPASLLDVEATLMERRRRDILDRINILASSGALRPDPYRQPELLPPGYGNPLYGANPGLGSVYNGMPPGAGAGANPAALQQLLGARSPTNAELAQLFAANNSGYGGAMPGLMGPPF